MLNEDWLTLPQQQVSVAQVKSLMHKFIRQLVFASGAPIQINPTDCIQRITSGNRRKRQHRCLEDAVITASQDRPNDADQPLIMWSNANES
jgi:hypothetical protein